MIDLVWLRGLLLRRWGRLASSAAGIAVAVGLLASIGMFLSASKATMTARAISGVTVAWQVEVQSGADPAAVLATTGATPGVRQAKPVQFARLPGLSATTGGPSQATTQTTGAAVVVGLGDGYATTFPDQLRPLVGSSNGVVLAQQTAANLHAAVGDTVTIARPGLPSIDVVVQGVVDLPHADSFFQSVSGSSASAGVNPAPTATRQAPPDNVIVVPSATWHQLFDPLAPSRADLVSNQIHVAYSGRLPTDPSAAYSQALRDARNLELRLAGTGVVGNNLAARLDAARTDSLQAQVLFLFLGVPGVVLAGVLTATVASSGADRRRRDRALLRTRGGAQALMIRLAIDEALITALTGALAGLAGAAVIGRAEFGSTSFGATTATAVSVVVAAVGAGIVIALAAVVGPAWRDTRRMTVSAARRTVGTRRAPWFRWLVDAMLLGGAALGYWLSSRHGHRLVLAPEGVPTVSVDYWAFVGPALLWVGMGLLTWHLTDEALHRGRGAFRRLLRPLAGGLAGTVAAALGRQRRLPARALTIVALSAAFAASTAVFNATYQHQAEVDAALTNGSDVAVSAAPGSSLSPGQSIRLAAVPGVTGLTALQHRFAYVGSDLQDLFGIDPASVAGATHLQDSYFQGGSTSQLLATMSARPDAVLVSAETAKDFQLNKGDTVHLRLQDSRTKQYTDVPFTYAGVVKEFPSAPTDSFIVANASYVADKTGSDEIGRILLATGSGNSSAVASRVRAMLGTNAQVTDIAQVRGTIGSSLTAVGLAGLTRVELGFAVVLAAAAAGLVLWLGLDERRRSLAITAALGATARQLGAFVWSEAVFVAVGGLLAGGLGGWVLTEMIVRTLADVFDPPPTSLSVPWAYLALVAGVGLLAVVVAAGRTVAGNRRPAVERLRDL